MNIWQVKGSENNDFSRSAFLFLELVYKVLFTKNALILLLFLYTYSIRIDWLSFFGC